jgi:hypothetical protein
VSKDEILMYCRGFGDDLAMVLFRTLSHRAQLLGQRLD